MALDRTFGEPQRRGRVERRGPAVIVAGDVVYATSGGEVHASGEFVGGDCPVAWHAPGLD